VRNAAVIDVTVIAVSGVEGVRAPPPSPRAINRRGDVTPLVVVSAVDRLGVAGETRSSSCTHVGH